jgi:predicted DCC family thiol-disulfide oxidoreductase YuxK
VSSDANDGKLTAYYDGKCPMCTAFMGAVARSEQKQAFDLRDMHAELSMPFTKDAVEKEIHVVDASGQVHKGAAGIVKIIEQHPRLRLLARVGRLPFIEPLLPLGYRVVAANRRFLFGPAARIFWLKTTVVLAFAVGLLMSSRLWIGPRSYPLAPVLDMFGSSIRLSDYVLFAALFPLAGMILVSAQPRKFIGAFLAIVAVFCALDATRWQPWVFQYSLVLMTLALFSWNSEDAGGRQRALNIVRLIIAGTYVFSGLQKINAEFVQFVFPEFVEPITKAVPAAAYPLYLLGMATPLVQVAFGVGLLTRKYRRISLVLAVAMHVFILALIGPLGDNWNSIVWPWTAAMAAFDLLLFTGRDPFTLREVLWTKRYPYHAAVLGLVAILPFLSFVNLWDSYLSAALYSGNVTEGFIYVSDAGRESLPEDIRRHMTQASPGTSELDLLRWGIEDLNVTPYPETRVYKTVARAVCGRLADPMQLILLVREQRMFLSTPEQTYRCADL